MRGSELTRAQVVAHRFRWFLLVLAIICTAAAAVWPFLVGGDLGWLLLYTGIFLGSQWLFLAPRKGYNVKLTETGRPMKLAVLSAALVAVAVSGGLVATALELPDWWEPLMNALEWPGLSAVLVVLWAFWLTIFFIYFRQGDRYTRLGGMIRALMAGSIAELVVAAPVYALLPDRHNCYCGRGSFFGLVLGGLGLIWTFGPGIVLLFLREKYRRLKLLEGEGPPS